MRNQIHPKPRHENDDGELVLLKPSSYIVEHKGDDADPSLIVIDSPMPALLIESISASYTGLSGRSKGCYTALLNGESVIVWDDMIIDSDAGVA